MRNKRCEISSYTYPVHGEQLDLALAGDNGGLCTVREDNHAWPAAIGLGHARDL